MLALISLLFAAAVGVVAQQSTVLVFPEDAGLTNDPITISADIIGVGSDGRTTYNVFQPSINSDGIIAVSEVAVTLVEASNYVSLGEVFAVNSDSASVGEVCTISGSIASCTIGGTIGSLDSIASTSVGPVGSITVQLDNTAALPTVTNAPNTNPTNSASNSRSGMITAIASQSSSALPASTSKPSGALNTLDASARWYAVLVASTLVGAIGIAY